MRVRAPGASPVSTEGVVCWKTRDVVVSIRSVYAMGNWSSMALTPFRIADANASSSSGVNDEMKRISTILSFPQ